MADTRRELEVWNSICRCLSQTPQLIAIPATSTASERVFSVCDTERRCRMQPETFEITAVSQLQYVRDEKL